MRRVILAVLGLGLYVAAASPAVPLTVYPGDWGEVSLAELHLLLSSVREHFYSAFSKPPPNRLEVRPSQGPPSIDNRSASGKPARIYLTARDRYFGQYTYQFAHELGHLACGYEQFQTLDRAPHPWMWFQEALCETASLFTLRRMSVNWQNKPPLPDWKSYAPHLRSYAQIRLDDPQRRLPGSLRLSEWYATHRMILATNATHRQFNGIVANRLLPLFEAHPRAWQAVRYLPHTSTTLAEYFQAWLARTPRKYAPIIRSIAREFQVNL